MYDIGEELPARKEPNKRKRKTKRKGKKGVEVEGLAAALEATEEKESEEIKDAFYHLVQDEALISHIHDEVLPPDEYYDELCKILTRQNPNVSAGLVEHVVALVAAFDTASAFALSFGIKKFQLAQILVKLVGEYVGREGRSPNPDLCKAIRDWPPIGKKKSAVENLKDLQGFLGQPITVGCMRGLRMPELWRPCVLS